MPGQPDWLAWNYDQVSVPNSFSSDLQNWLITVDWLISAPHLTSDRQGSLGFAAIRLWALGAGLLYRDLLQLHALGSSHSFALQRVNEWVGERYTRFKTIIGETELIMDAEFGPKAPSTHPTPDELMPDEPETRQLVPIIAQPSAIHQSGIDPNDLGPVLMTEAELEEGIVTPPLLDDPPSKARSHSAYLGRLLVLPALNKLLAALRDYQVRQLRDLGIISMLILSTTSRKIKSLMSP